MSAVDEAMDCATQELNSRQALTDLENGGGGVIFEESASTVKSCPHAFGCRFNGRGELLLLHDDHVMAAVMHRC